MIFLTVGTQLPFDRLVKAVDAASFEIQNPIVAQIGSGRYKPRNIQYHENLAPSEYDRLFRSADIIVSHAGIGTILTAQKYAKPLVVVPRRHDLREHRNDHQSATAREIAGLPGIVIIDDLETQLVHALKLHREPALPSMQREAFVARLASRLNGLAKSIDT